MPTNVQEAAIAQVVLEGVGLPATKRELLDYARRQDGGGSRLAALERIPDRQYGALDEVGEAICGTQPSFQPPGAHEPRAESGEVPGGRAYTHPEEEPGWIRDEPEILEYEKQLVREPAPAGEEAPEKGERDRRPRDP